MNRAVLQACLPALVALVVACGLLWLTVRISGARFDFRRLKALHRCEDGGVQSLSFVLTLPIFLLLMMLIVQISQLMIGVMGVHYAAFASARAAVVWLPADVQAGYEVESPNQISIDSYLEEDGTIVVLPSVYSEKFSRIRLAAVLAVAPFSPSRDLGLSIADSSPAVRNAADSTMLLYHSAVNTTNPRIDARIQNKIAWADQNTMVVLEWRDAQSGNGPNTLVSPSYNPRNHPNPDVVWIPNEAGWQDSVTVYVVHRFAMLPGPGRWLAQRLVWTDRLPSRVQSFLPADFLDQDRDDTGTYTVVIPASTTMTNDGLKPSFSFDHTRSIQN